ncbi:Probable E3 ubiquitin-protein ligase ipaH4.5 (Probable RING-type E3 ubiquitin transferase ipaH4.5) [Durusdinium trenchii]|uniref:Probable E3 ubiquitin-protein ligase ipaH4.5 (Probable RING-type E3 ubiquitin transferase ipaH4.5) n=1 Tax=Durusdinium trenchii TaxID=1381693 RepID=A0ABP0QFD5_9DINO
MDARGAGGGAAAQSEEVATLAPAAARLETGGDESGADEHNGDREEDHDDHGDRQEEEQLLAAWEREMNEEFGWMARDSWEFWVVAAALGGRGVEVALENADPPERPQLDGTTAVSLNDLVVREGGVLLDAGITIKVRCLVFEGVDFDEFEIPGHVEVQASLELLRCANLDNVWSSQIFRKGYKVHEKEWAVEGPGQEEASEQEGISFMKSTIGAQVDQVGGPQAWEATPSFSLDKVSIIECDIVSLEALTRIVRENAALNSVARVIHGQGDCKVEVNCCPLADAIAQDVEVTTLAVDLADRSLEHLVHGNLKAHRLQLRNATLSGELLCLAGSLMVLETSINNVTWLGAHSKSCDKFDSPQMLELINVKTPSNSSLLDSKAMRLETLEVLKVIGCATATRLIGPNVPDLKLTSVLVCDCPSLEAVEESLAMAEMLQVETCNSITEVHVGQCGAVELSNCESLESLSVVQPRAGLKVDGCNNLKQVCIRARGQDSKGSFVRLEVLRCASLEAIDTSTALSFAQLHLQDLPKLAFVGTMNVVTHVELRDLPVLLKIEFELGRDVLVAGKTNAHLWIENCLTAFHGVKNLQISECELLALTDDFAGLEKLEELRLFKLQKLEVLPRGLPPSLRVLQLSGCAAIKGMPSSWSGNALCNVSLRVADCDSLEGFPTGLHVSELQVASCPELKRVDSSLRVGKMVRDADHKTGAAPIVDGGDIIFEDCQRLQDFELRTVLGDLTLSECAVATLPENLRVLGDLELEKCSRLHAIPRGVSVGHESFESGVYQVHGGQISAADCAELESFQVEHVLGNLDLSRCSKLKELSPRSLSVGGDFDRIRKRLARYGQVEPAELAQALYDGEDRGIADLRHCTSLTKLPRRVTVANRLLLADCTGLRSLRGSEIKVGPTVLMAGLAGAKGEDKFAAAEAVASCPGLLDLRNCINLASLGTRTEVFGTAVLTCNWAMERLTPCKVALGIYLSDMSALKEIPASVSVGLELVAHSCDALKCIRPIKLWKPPKDMPREVAEDIGFLPGRLGALRAIECPKLTRLPAPFVVQELTVARCAALESVPKGLVAHESALVSCESLVFPEPFLLGLRDRLRHAKRHFNDESTSPRSLSKLLCTPFRRKAHDDEDDITEEPEDISLVFKGAAVDQERVSALFGYGGEEDLTDFADHFSVGSSSSELPDALSRTALPAEFDISFAESDPFWALDEEEMMSLDDDQSISDEDLDFSMLNSWEGIIEFYGRLAGEKVSEDWVRGLDPRDVVPDEANLQAYFEELPSTSDFERPRLRANLAQRVVQVLRLIRDDETNRDTVVQILVDATESCEDRVLLGLNRAGVMVEIARAKAASDRDAAMRDLGRRMFYMRLIDDFVSKKVAAADDPDDVDEIELMLHMQVEFRDEFDLPVVASSMKYMSCSEFSSRDKFRFRIMISEVTDADVQTFLEEWEPWLEIQRERDAASLKWSQLRQGNRRVSLGRTDVFGDDLTDPVELDGNVWSLSDLLRHWSRTGTDLNNTPRTFEQLSAKLQRCRPMP